MTVFWLAMLTFEYWAGFAIVLLNWRLSRGFNPAMKGRTLLGINVAVTLLLFAPVLTRAGFFGATHIPWWASDGMNRSVEMPWMAAGAVCAISLATTAFCIAKSRRST